MAAEVFGIIEKFFGVFVEKKRLIFFSGRFKMNAGKII